MQRLLVEIFCIGIYRSALGLFRSAVGFQLAVTALPANCTACAMLGKFFGFMPTFYADVLMLNLMDFSVRPPAADGLTDSVSAWAGTYPRYQSAAWS